MTLRAAPILDSFDESVMRRIVGEAGYGVLAQMLELPFVGLHATRNLATVLSRVRRQKRVHFSLSSPEKFV
eukprot:519943-Pleurochrysis_carterae.AAC.1